MDIIYVFLSFSLILPVFYVFFTFFLLKRWVSGLKKSAFEMAKSYFETDDPDQPSQFGSFVDIVTSQLASKIVSSVRAQLNQASGVVSRNDKAVDGALATDILSAASPIAGMALNAFPQLAKLIKKNPSVVGLVLDKMAGVNMLKSQSAGQPAEENRSNGHQTALTIN